MQNIGLIIYEVVAVLRQIQDNSNEVGWGGVWRRLTQSGMCQSMNLTIFTRKIIPIFENLVEKGNTFILGINPSFAISVNFSFHRQNFKI